MGSFLQDLRFAIRTLLKRPAFTLVAVGSLALGIAVNATIFSWVERILLHPMTGVPGGRELVTVKNVATNGDLLDSSYLDYRDFRDQTKTLAGVIAFKQRPLYIGDAPNMERVWSEMVSGNFFDALKVKPLRGRTFSAEEQVERPGGAPVAVISESMWRGRFQSDPNIIGRLIKLNQKSFTIIGVTPAEFAGTVNGLKFDLWVPLMMHSELTGSWNWLEDRNSRPLALMGRLAPGADLDRANTEVAAIAKHLETAYPASNRGMSARVLSLEDSPDGVQSVLGKLLKVLLAVGAAVLLIVCANVSNLLLARATARQKEFGIRLSLGATRARLLRQLFTEALALALAGGAVGLLAASWMTRGIELLLPATDLPVANIAGGFDSAGLLFTIALCLTVTILCGLAPAWQIFRRKALEIVRESGRGLSAGVGARALRGALVVSEISLALIALIGSGLFIRSFENAKTANPGFQPDHVLLAGLDLSQSHYSQEQSVSLLRRLRDHLLQTPGIQSASMCEDVPLGFSGGSWEELRIQGYAPREGENMKLYRNVVSPGYFATLQIPLLDGRDFTDLDDRKMNRVAIVNESFVKRFLAGGPALGHKFHGFGEDITIVGVARDSKYHQLSEPATPYFYIPIAQFYSSGMGIGIEVRTAERPQAFADKLRKAIQSVDPNVAISGTAPFVSYMSASYFAQKVGASLLSVLGVIALALATLGLYGVMTYSMTQRSHEIGIRMAIGAKPSEVLLMMLREGMRLCALGTIAGVALALAVMRLASSVLYGVASNDLATCLVATAVLVLFAVVATWIPARRASRIDPIEALRWE
ncbi:MAG TPA: ABC transporter permease [Bryobacteraceae bacterium]|nr:ABC transporter permease [Bryobacteraceae bacterium]